MGTLTIIKPGLFTNLQDQGRPGLAYYAIPPSGPLDQTASELANVILLNDPSQPTLECNFVPPTLRFETSVTISLTGADMHWKLDGIPVKRYQTLSAAAGSCLSGSPASEGCRAYIGIHGTLETERTFGSAACFALCRFGGNQGKPFAQGDRIHWKTPPTAPLPLKLSLKASRSTGEPLRILPGPEYPWLTSQSKAALTQQPFSITSDSNRMGARLIGPELDTEGRSLSDSLPLLPGFVQLTPVGQVIVVLQDGQTTGGYPRIAYLPTSSLGLLNQIPLRQSFRFSFR